jgi:catechol 2,3-dioxygenase-like lactoylglutathione lyase family enzyme
MSVIKSIRHIGIVVDNMDLQLGFYRDILGLEVYYDQVENGRWINTLLNIGENCYAHIIKLGKNNNILVELISFREWLYKDPNIKPANEMGITHLSLEVDGNLNNLFYFMDRKGVKFVSPPNISPDNKVKVCFCYDFENNLIELVEVL